MSESKKISFTRYELYELVWSQPLKDIAITYAIPTNELKKVCSRMKITVPSSTYWRKNERDKWHFKRYLTENYYDKETVCLSIDSIKQLLSTETPLSKIEREIENTHGSELKIPIKLLRPDILITQAKTGFENIKKNKWYSEGEIMNCGEGNINIAVTLGNATRALNFIDTLIKLLKKRGHVLIVRSDKTYIKIYGEEIELSLREKSKRIKIKRPDTSWIDTELQPAGKLSLKIDRYYSNEWNDGLILIEDRLVNIIAKIELLGKKLQRQTINSEIERKKREEKERLEQILLDKITKEKDCAKALFKEANRWQHVQTLRSYIHHFEEKAAANKTIYENMEEYIKWVNHIIDWYDPTINATDRYLDEGFKEELQKMNEEKQSKIPHVHHNWGKSHWESHW